MRRITHSNNRTHPMATEHAKPGEVISIRPLGAQLAEHRTQALIKTENIEVVRLVLPAGKEIPPHQVPGEITVQCLEGRVAFQTPHGTREMTAGDLLYLTGGDQHAVSAI